MSNRSAYYLVAAIAGQSCLLIIFFYSQQNLNRTCWRFHDLSSPLVKLTLFPPLCELHKLIILKSNYPKAYAMERIPITLFIHGTLPPDPILSLPPVHRFFHCPKGITQVSDLQESHTKDFLTTLSLKHPFTFPAEHCYAFGWSGHLNHTLRKEAAHELFKDLLKLQKEYALDNRDTFLRLITHSHGGNVALCLKSAADTYSQSNLSIDELILLACPVQIETADYAQDKLFAKVYSIHSHHDLLQILDPQGLHAFLDYLKNFGLEFTLTNLKELGPLFSERHFPKYCQVTELNVKYPHRELFHIEFLLPKFMESLPMLIKHMQTNTLPDELTHIFNNGE